MNNLDCKNLVQGLSRNNEFFDDEGLKRNFRPIFGKEKYCDIRNKCFTLIYFMRVNFRGLNFCKVGRTKIP